VGRGLTPGGDAADELRPDCASCFGLCCVAPAFSKSSDFAINKPAGTPCVNLGADFGCGIHERLRANGFPGCVVYDCFGAGQKIAQVTFGGRDWRGQPGTAPKMFAAYAVMRDLHELLYYLTEALTFPDASGLIKQLQDALDRTRAMTLRSAADLIATEPGEVRRDVNPLLLRASELARARVPGARLDHRGADLIRAKLRGADLRGASLRGARLIGADLREADLRWADMIGADLRGADLRGADLRHALFLTQSQLESARGDACVMLSPVLSHPAHWRNS
jgi:uncharacterized protein YjbI with pentapeptide repeats